MSSDITDAEIKEVIEAAHNPKNAAKVLSEIPEAGGIVKRSNGKHYVLVGGQWRKCPIGMTALDDQGDRWKLNKKQLWEKV